MLTLEAAFHRPAGPLGPAERTPEGAAEMFGALLGSEIAQACDGRDDEVALSFTVSTIMDMPFASQWLSWDAIRAVAREITPAAPRNFTASYECAGWGYALGYARRRLPEGGLVAITVADVNLLDIGFWRESEHWGRSGFGVATVLLRLPPADKIRMITGAAKSTQAMGEFCVDLRKWLANTPEGLANTPFLPPEMAAIYDHFLPMARIMPDLHARFGHAFGSDTWLSWITHLDGGLLRPGETHIATSASLRGFWAICDLAIDPGCRWGLAADETRRAA